MKRVRRLTPTLKELERKFKKETDPKERQRLRSRIYAKTHSEQKNEANRRYRAAHPLTEEQRKRYRENHYHALYGGGGCRRYNKNA